VYVSAIISPVTQEAEVEVKSAFTNPTGSPFLLAIGRDSKNAPVRISMPKPKATILG